MSIILGIAIGVAACLVALLFVYHNNHTWFAANSAKLDALAVKLDALAAKASGGRVG